MSRHIWSGKVVTPREILGLSCEFRIPAARVQAAATLLAEYLPNDEDGVGTLWEFCSDAASRCQRDPALLVAVAFPERLLS